MKNSTSHYLVRLFGALIIFQVCLQFLKMNVFEHPFLNVLGCLIMGILFAILFNGWYSDTYENNNRNLTDKDESL